MAVWLIIVLALAALAVVVVVLFMIAGAHLAKIRRGPKPSYPEDEGPWGRDTLP